VETGGISHEQQKKGDSTLLVCFRNLGKGKPSVAAIDLHEKEPVHRWVEKKAGDM
jgi:hypothetical protein